MIDTATTTHDLARARLTGARSQRAFRILLDSLSRPGTIHTIDAVGLPPGVPAPLLLPLALADVEVGVAVLSGDPDDPWTRFLVDVTGSRPVPVPDAAIVVLLGGFTAQDVLSLRRGTDESPEGGARVAMVCRSLRVLDDADDTESDAAVDGEIEVTLRGPGVDGSVRLAIAGLPVDVLDALAVANAGFPSGVDTWLVTPDGTVAAVPRSSHLSIEGR